jgi:hypothetical protein
VADAPASRSLRLLGHLSQKGERVAPAIAETPCP